MKSTYILHGCCDHDEYFSDEYPSPSNCHWLPWLQKQLVRKGYFCQTPEMPEPYKGSFSQWRRIFDTFAIDENTSLIGHSCGGGFLLRWLSENDRKIDKLVLVVPWLDPKRTRGNFLEGIIDPTLANRMNEIHVFYSADEDVIGVKETVDLVTTTYPQMVLHCFASHGHFCLGDMKTEQFTELNVLFN